MPSAQNTTLETAIGRVIQEAGLTILTSEQGSTAGGEATSIFVLGLPGAGSGERTSRLELHSAMDLSKPGLLPELTSHLREEAQRLKSPRPDVCVTLGGIPLSLTDFEWPFHRSVSGADAFIVHGLVSLADGTDSGLHAKIAAALTVTLAEVLPAPEQPYAESFIYNATRKILDQGQLELLKSGGRQPIPVTMRYYSRWRKQFVFNDTNDETRRKYLASKIYWASGVLGESRPIWIADPRDGQYLDTTQEELTKVAAELAAEGLAVADGQFASATPKLLEKAPEYRARLDGALDFTKPTFNEEMRAGHTNM